MAKPRIKKYPNGGTVPPKRQPIVVTDPNDPRLRAYNDSNEVYKSYIQTKKALDNRNYEIRPLQNDPNKAFDDMFTQYDKGRFIEGKNLTTINKDKLKAYEFMPTNTLGDIYHINTTIPPQIHNRNIRPYKVETRKSTRKEDFGDNHPHIDTNNGPNLNEDAMPLYKYQNPVQPVVYQKPVSKEYYINESKAVYRKPVVNSKPVYKPTTPIIPNTSNAIQLTSIAPQEPVQQPVQTQPAYTSQKQTYQGREFMETTGLQPGLYHPEQIELAKQNQMKKGKRAFAKGGQVQYDLGGVIKGASTGASLGTPLGPYGMAAGAVLGGIYGGINSMPKPQEIIEQPPAQPYQTIKGLGNNVSLYAQGGMTNANAEVELNEVIKTPDGQTMIADAPPHSKGGLKLNLKAGSKITSDRLLNPVTGNTFAKDQASIERSKASANRKLKSNPKDIFAQKTVQILENASNMVYDLQEASKVVDTAKQIFKNGGMVKYTNGGENPFDPWNQPNEYQMYQQRQMSPVVTLQGKAELSDLGLNKSNPYTPNTIFEQNNSLLNSQSNPTDAEVPADIKPNYLGLGMSLAGDAMQFATSFRKDPITRIRNNQFDPAVQNMQDSINRQRRLRYNPNDELAAQKESELSTNKYIDTNISNASVRMGNRLANRNASLQNSNRIYGNANRANIGIQAQANAMQSSLSELLSNLGYQDAMYEKDYRDNTLMRDANLRNIRGASMSNAGKNTQVFMRDQELLKLLPLMFPNAKIS